VSTYFRSGVILFCNDSPTDIFLSLSAAIMMEDSQTGQRYLQVRHFLTRGIPASILSYAVITSVGYGLCIAVGF
jgi:phosphate transporter